MIALRNEVMTTAIVDELETYGPNHCDQLSYEEAAAYTRRLARSHYENFSVVSWFLPRRLREDFRNVYAFCRWADDLGDEIGDRDRSLELLAWWRSEIDACYAGEPRHPVFVALHSTIQRHDVPRKPFDDLVDAFVQDQTVTRYESWGQVIDYCTRSADPVGRLVLYVCGYRDEKRQQLSDTTCTALQLTNFWQDVRRDILERDRVYIPADVASSHGLDIDTLVSVVAASSPGPNSGPGRRPRDRQREQPGMGNALCRGCGSSIDSAGIGAIRGPFKATVKELVGRTRPLFERGKSLGPLLAADIRSDIGLFTAGGESILRMIERQDYDTLVRRPSLSKGAKVVLMLRAVVGRLWPGGAVVASRRDGARVQGGP